MSENTTDLRELDSILDLFENYLTGNFGDKITKEEAKQEIQTLISNREKLLLDRVEKEVIGDDIPSDFDHDAGFCQNCDFQPTDGTENCICKIVNMARFKQRQKLTTLRKELDGGRDE